MFEKVKTLKASVIKLYPYYVPTYQNIVRTAGFLTAVIAVPIANYFIPSLFINNNNNSDNQQNNVDITTTFASAFVIASLTGFQHLLSTMLTTSTMVAIKVDHTKRLMDDSNFLMHGRNKDVSSLQYTTVGVGVRDFAGSAVPAFISLPMYTISSITNFVSICIATSSFGTSAIVLGFTSGYFILSYLSSKGYFAYQVSNQRIENDLVAHMGFIEAHRDAIPLMSASEIECLSLVKKLHKVNESIPYLSFFDFSQTLTSVLGAAIASQFLGGYYKSDTINDLNNSNAKVLNIMIMALLSNTQNVAWILSANYSYMKLNLDQLNAFDKSYKECALTNKSYNKMKQKFTGEHLLLKDFTVYRPSVDEEDNLSLIVVVHKINLKLAPNKIYKLSASSGEGKTTFLKAITNKLQYTEGEVTLPENSKNSTSFIPQTSFVPKGTLLDIIVYPFEAEHFLKLYYSQSSFYEAKHFHQPREIKQKEEVKNASPNITMSETPLLGFDEHSDSQPITYLINDIKYLLAALSLIPNVIKPEELLQEDINWNERLSGGEKQKVAIIRALLTKPKFIIMDEATSALDKLGEQKVYKVIRDYLKKIENYIVIYTKHGDEEKYVHAEANFADIVLNLSGQGIDFDEGVMS